MSWSKRWQSLLPGWLRGQLTASVLRQRVVENTGWLIADRMLRLGVGVVVTVWIARYLGPQDYGTFSYAIAFAALFGAMANIGLDSIVVRDIVRHPAEADSILGTAFALKSTGAISALTLSIVVISIIRPADWMMLLLVSLVASGYLFQAFDVLDLWFQASMNIRRSLLARNMAFLAIALVKISLILLEAPLLAFAIAGLAEVLLASIALLVVFKSERRSIITWRFERQRALSLVREGWPLMLSGIVVTLYMRIDVIMLGEMLNEGAVGVYSAAVKISELWYFIPTVVVTAVSPALITAREANQERFQLRLIQLFRIMAIISAAISIPIFVIAEPLILALFGEAFSSAAEVLRVHVWAMLFVSLGVASSQYLVMEGLGSISLQRTAVGAIANIVLNLLWIPSHGAVGAAWATLIAYGIANFWLIQNTKALTCLKMMLRALAWPARGAWAR